jgi:hypothetical protein
VELEATVATICVLPQITTAPGVLPSHTAPVPCTAPKLLPVIITVVPAAAEAGATLVIAGANVKDPVLLATPFTVTTTLPLSAPAGTGALMLVALQPPDGGVASVPPMVTVLLPWVEPKFVPAWLRAFVENHSLKVVALIGAPALPPG